MGYARITVNKLNGLYDVELKRDISRLTTRLAALGAQLNGLGGKIADADTVETSAYATLALANDALLAAISALAARTGTEAEVRTATQAQERAAQEHADKKRAVLVLKLQRDSLVKEQDLLQKVPEYMVRSDVWCADFRENLQVGAVYPTLEVNGEASMVLLMPGGATTGLGMLQPAAATTPAGLFRNLALLPCWQRWKPTYRVAQVTAVHPSPDSLDIVVYDAFSSRQGLLINQDGTPGKAYKPPISGWQRFAQENPNDPLVDNIFTGTVTLTPALMAQLREVNDEINSHSSYKLDIDQYGRLEQ